jgi:pimeloyl-ACP methyl ester carboxylesterase
LDQDIIAALRFLRSSGTESVSIVGGSTGAAAAARAATRLAPGEVDALVLLAPPPVSHPERLQADRILVIVSAGDRLRSAAESIFDRVVGAKYLEILPGQAHAQHIFKTEHADTLMTRLLDFLLEDEQGN